jgi:hypothetical protein
METMTAVLEPTTPYYLAEHAEHATEADSTIVTLRSPLGIIEVKVCAACGYEDVKCLHVNNTIGINNLTIVCTLCGR